MEAPGYLIRDFIATMIYLVPSLLAPEAVETIPHYILEAVKNCRVIYAENARTARRFLRKMDPTISIDQFTWYEIHKNEPEMISTFRNHITKGENICIISEAGCPGVADPGQVLTEVAQQMGAIVKPLAGPSSILLALMASGLNGQQFCFNGYLPVTAHERVKKIRQLEEESQRKQCTQIFIETPYRNDALLDSLLKNCHGNTLLCIASEITSANEWIRTRSIADWKKEKISLHKKTVTFLLLRK